MANLTKVEKLNALLTEQVTDMIEQYKFIQDQMETFKFKVKEAMKENDVKKWETDLFTVTLRDGFASKRADTAKMKNESIYITNAETGELEEVNAYDYFSKSSYTAESLQLKVKEDKYGG